MMILTRTEGEQILINSATCSFQVQTEVFEVKEEIADEQSEVKLEWIVILQVFLV